MAGKKIGILALQGAFIEHQHAIQRCGAQALQVRTARELEQVDGLIIPGGESTTIGKLMQEYQLDTAITNRYQQGMAIWGTCAGMILLAREIVGMDQPLLGLMDIAVVRNGFGRQADSFETELEIDTIGPVRGVFIRAPYAEKVWGPARVMASHEGKIVMAEEDRLLVTAFHPELTENDCIHDYFIKKVAK